ncbi:MAG: hypothetical protein IPI49_19855 [Myxococcales bacterium]|nr:hypothetical protein [Myxococcales bacterium]
MSHRVDYFFRQKVTEAELDLGFALLEQADRNLAVDLGLVGVITGAQVTPHEPVADLSVDLTAPARAYDQAGQRIAFGTGQTVDCGADWQGLPTAVATTTHERWLGVFLRFDRQLSDPRTDGNSQQVYFRRDESFELLVRQAPEGPIGAAPRVALEPEELLLCDIRLRAGQTQILASDIDPSRRQAFVVARATAVGVDPGLWSILAPATPTVQAALDAADGVLSEHLSAVWRHSAADIDCAPSGFVSGTTVQAVVTELIDKLAASAPGAAGASRIGADGIPGAPWALAPGTVDSQLALVVGLLNQHAGAVAGAHPASAVAAAPHNHLTSTSVQGQLQELVTDLRSTTTGVAGASLVGTEAVAGAPTALPAGPLSTALAALLGAINGHVTKAASAHAASAVSVADAGGNLTASQVEAALAEILDAFKGGHFRGNETDAGLHRSLRQPALGGSKALVLDSAASGDNASRFRIYADASSIWFTVNAAWVDPSWRRDASVIASAAIRLSAIDLEFLHHGSMAPSFDAWSRSWRLPMDAPAGFFVATGAMAVHGRVGLQWSNANTAPQALSAGTAVTYRTRLAAPPSSVTLGVLSASAGFVGVPVVSLVDPDGFVLSSTQTLAGLATAWWHGFYLAIA